MPRLPKSWRPQPTKEEIFLETWGIANKVIKKAMIDKGIRYDKDLAQGVGLTPTDISKSFNMRRRWTYEDLCSIVSFLGIRGDDALQILGIRRP